MDPRLVLGTIKPPVHINFGESKTEFHSGCSIIDVTFPNVFFVEIAEIAFKNYYTANVTVKAKRKALPGETQPKWKTCVRRVQLMAHAHCEAGAESDVTLSSKQVTWPLHNISALRFVLRQPSPVWRDFKIHDLRFYKTPMDAPLDTALPKWLLEPADGEEKTLKQIASIPVVSKSLQQMWALTEQVSDKQPSASIGRYDVDGCYEINLLSYT